MAEQAMIEAFVAASDRYVAAVKALFKINPDTKDNYASGSPTKDQDTYERFIELNDAGKALTSARATLTKGDTDS